MANLARQKMITELQEQAVRYFCERPKNFPEGRPYNCCESVLLALAKPLGLDTDLIPRIGTAIGAGVSLNGLLCGSISSVLLLLGMKHGRMSPEESPKPLWDIADTYVSAFRDKFGAVDCRKLTGLNLKTEEGLKEYFARVHDYRCADRLRYAVAMGAEALGL